MKFRFKNKKKTGLLSPVFCLLPLLLLTNACQKDDICPESAETTPLLVIRFYDIDNPSQTKPVLGLNLIAEGQTDSLFVTEQTIDSIAIPLKTFQNYTHYQFIAQLGEEPDTELPPNSDEIEFSYFPNGTYVSKACGFRTEYLDFQAIRVAEPTGENWIRNIVIEQTTVTNDTRAHLSIFH